MNDINFFSTTRYLKDGATTGNYANFNLATHTGDTVELVEKNRALLIKHYNLPSPPKWLTQTHSNICLTDKSSGCYGDSIITAQKGVVCAILTADCLPIFAFDSTCSVVGVAHAGWAGLLNGVIENFIAKFPSPSEVNVVLGTALSQQNFIVNADFKINFLDKNIAFEECFITFKGKYKFDIYKCATIILQETEVIHVKGNTDCTFNNPNLFSYRRDGVNSGRQAHLIWMK